MAWLGGLLLIYLVLAYVLMPVGWRIHERKHRAMDAVDRVTHTANGIPGDPINLALVGTETNLVQGMIAAGWYPADPITLESSLRIAVDSVFRRPDDQAPVSNLYLFGRKQDLASSNRLGTIPGSDITFDSGAGTSWRRESRCGLGRRPTMSGSA